MRKKGLVCEKLDSRKTEMCVTYSGGQKKGEGEKGSVCVACEHVCMPVCIS